MSRKVGTVKWFNGQKGYGFITPKEGGDELFVHQTAIRADGYRSLAEGELVEFEIDNTDGKKTKAIDVSGPGGVNVRGNDRNTPKRDNNFSGSKNGGDNGYGRQGGRSGGGGGRDGVNGYVGRSGGGRGNDGCYSCGEVGHLARDCAQKASNGGGRAGDGRCYKCGEVGHMSRNCESNESSYSRGGGVRNTEIECYNCGKLGHISRDCDAEDNGGHGGRYNQSRGADFKCFNCGGSGHYAKDCPTPKDNSKN